MSERFEADLNILLTRMCINLDGNIEKKLKSLRNKLISLHFKNMAKINHSVMELVCAKHLFLAGYEVDLERPLDSLNCDLYATKGLGSLIIEVETGFIPPEHALYPITYSKARIASKITRYSRYAEKFSLGVPPHYIMQIPLVFSKPPRYRTTDEIERIKNLCDLYYKRPAVSFEEIKSARIYTIYIIDVDNVEVKETDPVDYAKNTERWIV